MKQNSLVFICLCLLGILNYEGLAFDFIFGGIDIVAPGDLNITDSNIEVAGESITAVLNKELEVPYDWGFGTYAYVGFLYAAFMGTIVLEGVETSLMASSTPPELNDYFLNTGLLATLVGTLGRVVGDALITSSAFLDKSIYVDFVNATYLPCIPLTFVGYLFVKLNYEDFW